MDETNTTRGLTLKTAINNKSIFTVGILVFLFKLAIAFTTEGTNDVITWKIFAKIIEKQGGVGLYMKMSYFNHPPFIIHILNSLRLVESITNIDFSFWLRFLSSTADLGTLVIMLKMFQQNNGIKITLPSLLLMALAPISIMVAGFHGNTDPILIFFLVLSLYLMELSKEDFYNWLPKIFQKYFIRFGLTNLFLAAIAYALSANIKIIAFIVAPCIFFYLSDNKKRLEFTLVSALTWIIISIPYIFLVPKDIVRHCFGYNSLYGLWGISKIAITFLPSEHWLNIFYDNHSKFLIVAIIIFVTLYMNFVGKKVPIFVQISFIFFIFLTLSPGFGIQYLCWLVPLVIFLGTYVTLFYYVTSGIFAFMLYNYWSGGFPWYFANATVAYYDDFMGTYQYICWFTVVMLTLFCLFYIIKWKKSDSQGYIFNFLESRFFIFWTLFSLLIVSVMAFSDLFIKEGFYLYAIKGETYEIRQKESSIITLRVIGGFYRIAGLKNEALEAYNEVLKFTPKDEVVYYQVSTIYCSSQEWKKAIEVAEKVIKLNPNYRNILDYLESVVNLTSKDLINIASELIQQQNNLDAVLACEKAIKLEPNNANAYGKLSISYNNLFMVKEAELAFEKALKLDPKIEVVSYNYDNSLKIRVKNYIDLALRFFTIGEFRKSTEFFKKALDIEPNNALVYNNLCVAYIQLKEINSAIEAGEKALSIDPNFTSAKNNLDWAKREKK